VVGRIDDQIISGGEKISLGAIDAFLNADPASEFMSCAIPSVEWGEQLCLASSHHFDQSAISQLLRAEFGGHAVPKLFLQGVELPRSAIGKADRRTLAQKFERMQP
jgi:O-succinylbenzoic acid--CoA ligase